MFDGWGNVRFDRVEGRDEWELSYWIVAATEVGECSEIVEWWEFDEIVPTAIEVIEFGEGE